MYKFLKWCMIALIAVCMPLAITSCGGDDDDDEPNKNGNTGGNKSYAELIIGVWSDEDGGYWDESNGVDYGFEFKKNGTCYIYGSIYGAGIYKVRDKELTITYENQYGDNYTERYIIVKLNNDVLVLRQDYYYDDSETYYRVK